MEDLLKITGVRGPISVHVEVAKEGSIILRFAIEVAQQAIFGSWQHLFDLYLSVGAHEALRAAKEFAVLHDDINAYFAKNAFDVFLLGMGIPRLMDWAKRQKNAPTVTDDKGRLIPKQYAIGLHKMVKRGGYKKAMRPFIENEVKEVELRTVGPDRGRSSSTKIDTANFNKYLSDKEQILPKLKNGAVQKFHASLVGLEKSMGEHLKFNIAGFPRPHNTLVSYPEEGKDTADYKDYYDKNVLITAEVVRISMFSKPKLKLLAIEFSEGRLL